MNPFRVVRRSAMFTAAIASGILVLMGCSDSPTAPEEEHVEAAGFAIELDGTEILRYLDAEGGTPTLSMAVGTTYEAVVVFLDPDGDPLEHEEHEGEEEDELRVTIGNGSVLSWTPEEHDHEEEGGEEHLEFHGELEALSVGSTTMQLCILHEDHCDYESPLVAVEVE